jgi:enoyl-CoA hydratase
MTEDRQLIIEADRPVARVTLNRPGKRNALSRGLLAEIGRAFAELGDDDGIGLVVLRGAGEQSFAAGGDLVELEAVRTLDETREFATQAKAALDAIRRFPAPVVAGLNGDALGGGAELAMACDFRVAAAHARIGFLQGRLNITTAWGGGIDLIRTVGRGRALELLCSTRLLTGAEAIDLGLFDHVAGDEATFDEALDEFIAPLLARTPRVLRSFKQLTSAVAMGDGREALDRLETELFAQNWVQPDHWSAAKRALKR